MKAHPPTVPPVLSRRPGATELRRGRRHAGANAATATLLATLLVLLVNGIGMRLYVRWPVAQHLHGALAERTLQLLRSTEGDLELIAFFEHRHPLAAPVRALLQEFAEAARTVPNLRVRTRTVDPNRDVAAAGDVARLHAAPPNSLIVRARNNHRVLATEDLLGDATGLNLDGSVTDFIGEAAVASAIWNATRAHHPILCFLSGNGEYDPFDYDPLTGYSTVARHLQRDGFAVRSLALSSDTPIPDDCSLLVIAGPRTEIGHHAIEQIGTYLATGGRLLLLLDSAVDPGIRSLLEAWGIVVFSPSRRGEANGGLESSASYGQHPVTRGLQHVETAFRAPCRFAIRQASLQTGHADRPHASVLITATSPPDAASSLDDPEASEATALAVASERGVQGTSDGGSLARVIAIGDAQFAANGMVNGGYDGNRDLLLSAVDWLTEQDVLIGRMPITFRVLRSGIPTDGWWRTAALVAVLWPGSVWLVGLVLTHRRRAALR